MFKDLISSAHSPSFHHQVSIRTDRMGPSATAKVFELDAVLGPESDQAAVWAEVQPLVTSAMDGYQACILAFGQTGRWVGLGGKGGRVAGEERGFSGRDSDGSNMWEEIPAP